MFFVYILKSELTGRFYVGQTDGVEKRLARHNKGYVKSTKPHRPWKLVYTETFGTRAGAMSREKEIKLWKSRVKIIELVTASR